MSPDETTFPAMRFRKLRIAWSVFWALASVLLIIWFHSCPQPVFADLSPPSPVQQTQSKLLKLTFGGSQVLLIVEHPLDPKVNVAKTLTIDVFGFAWQRTNSWIYIAIPYWLLIAASAIVAYCFSTVLTAVYVAATKVPWSSRFSLRTLLIATTLVAVVLGLVVYASRSGQ